MNLDLTAWSFRPLTCQLTLTHPTGQRPRYLTRDSDAGLAPRSLLLCSAQAEGTTRAAEPRTLIQAQRLNQELKGDEFPS